MRSFRAIQGIDVYECEVSAIWQVEGPPGGGAGRRQEAGREPAPCNLPKCQLTRDDSGAGATFVCGEGFG